MTDIRAVRPEDAEEIAAIYAHHVLHGTATFDLDPPSVGDTLAKIERISAAGWPFIVAVLDGSVCGYAYATQFRDRAAYRFACEDSIYVHPAKTGRGVGKALIAALCDAARQAGFRQIIAVIGGGEPASIGVHKACGFEVAGRFHAVGWKKERWLDSVYMQRSLGEGSAEPPHEAR
jgi:phosphinothricin acetyltransferase